MRVEWNSVLLGAAGGALSLVAAGALLLSWNPGPKEQRHRTLMLASGRTLEVTMLYLGLGDEHSSRGAVDDGLCVEYVVSSHDAGVRDAEAAEVFAAVRPLVESLGLGSAWISAFPTLLRKGHYERYAYTRDASGSWTSTHADAKVFVND